MMTRKLRDNTNDTEEFYLWCAETMPEDRVKEEIAEFQKRGQKFDLDNTSLIYRMSFEFHVSPLVMLVRILQIFPELQKRLAL